MLPLYQSSTYEYFFGSEPTELERQQQKKEKALQQLFGKYYPIVLTLWKDPYLLSRWNAPDQLPSHRWNIENNYDISRSSQKSSEEAQGYINEIKKEKSSGDIIFVCLHADGEKTWFGYRIKNYHKEVEEKTIGDAHGGELSKILLQKGSIKKGILNYADKQRLHNKVTSEVFPNGIKHSLKSKNAAIIIKSIDDLLHKTKPNFILEHYTNNDNHLKAISRLFLRVLLYMKQNTKIKIGKRKKTHVELLIKESENNNSLKALLSAIDAYQFKAGSLDLPPKKQQEIYNAFVDYCRTSVLKLEKKIQVHEKALLKLRNETVTLLSQLRPSSIIPLATLLYRRTGCVEMGYQLMLHGKKYTNLSKPIFHGWANATGLAPEAIRFISHEKSWAHTAYLMIKNIVPQFFNPIFELIGVPKTERIFEHASHYKMDKTTLATFLKILNPIPAFMFDLSLYLLLCGSTLENVVDFTGGRLLPQLSTKLLDFVARLLTLDSFKNYKNTKEVLEPFAQLLVLVLWHAHIQPKYVKPHFFSNDHSNESVKEHCSSHPNQCANIIREESKQVGIDIPPETKYENIHKVLKNELVNIHPDHNPAPNAGELTAKVNALLELAAELKPRH